MPRTLWIAPAAAACLVLAGCGGGGDDHAGGGNPGGGNVPGTDVPVTVQTSIDDVIAFARALIAGTSETTEPVVIEGATLATSETDEPVGL